MKKIAFFLLALAVSVFSGLAAGRQSSQPNWSTLGAGTDAGVFALASFDDGSGGGTALYAGGAFTNAGGVPETSYIARWNGSTWSTVGGGLSGVVFALTTFDDGNGPALYAGGTFEFAGGVLARGIAKWDGSSWSALGSGLQDGTVAAMAVYDDGGGPALYIGGGLTKAGPVPVNNIAKWDGTSWSALRGGMKTTVRALTVFDDGSGPALFIGAFNSPETPPLQSWNGLRYSLRGSPQPNGSVFALRAFDDGSGSALYVGGVFTTAAGVSVNRIARWNGTSFSPLGSGMNNTFVLALEVFDDGTGGGPALYAGGLFTNAGGASGTNHVARWDGSSWKGLGNGTNGGVSAFAVFDDGSGAGPGLYVGGAFTNAGGVAANNIAQWSCPMPPCPTFGATLNNGTGINPLCFSIPVGPIIGTNMEMRVDATSLPDVRWSSVEGRGEGGSLVMPFGGELLLNRQSPLFHKSIVAGSGVMTHSFFVNPALLGQTMVFQGWLGRGDARVLQFCNAFDLIPGCSGG